MPSCAWVARTPGTGTRPGAQTVRDLSAEPTSMRRRKAAAARGLLCARMVEQVVDTPQDLGVGIGGRARIPTPAQRQVVDEVTISVVDPGTRPSRGGASAWRAGAATSAGARRDGLRSRAAGNVGECGPSSQCPVILWSLFRPVQQEAAPGSSGVHGGTPSGTRGCTRMRGRTAYPVPRACARAARERE